jgi:hypothetical protein
LHVWKEAVYPLLRQTDGTGKNDKSSLKDAESMANNSIDVLVEAFILKPHLRSNAEKGRTSDGNKPGQRMFYPAITDYVTDS